MSGSRSGLSLLRVRIGSVQFGPGKANLLAAIDETGSISAAGRRLRMSYRRAWSLTEEMNAAFSDPLVVSSRGGQSGGGASLTETGRQVLASYRRMEEAARGAIADEIARLDPLVRVEKRAPDRSMTSDPESSHEPPAGEPVGKRPQ